MRAAVLAMLALTGVQAGPDAAPGPAATDLAATPAGGVPSGSVPDPEDVVVVRRRMRGVILNYAVSGTRLRRCDVRRSSGDAWIDRTMCRVLAACVAAGERQPGPARACMYRRIDAFEAETLGGGVTPSPLLTELDPPVVRTKLPPPAQEKWWRLGTSYWPVCDASAARTGTCAGEAPGSPAGR